MAAPSVSAADCGTRQRPVASQAARLGTSAAQWRAGRPMCVRSSSSVQATALRQQRRGQQALEVLATYPEPETEKERSPIDYPQEWITPQPSRRPDIFPEFERLQTPLPKPMPGDPEMPDEEEEEEKEKNPEKEDPDEEKPKPDEPAPSEE